MTEFEREFFRKVKFAGEEIRKFLESSRHDLEIARKDPFPEVCFTYSFQVRSIPGHHAKIIEKMSEMLKDPEISTMGHAMRTRRNTDLYGGGKPVSENEAKDYLRFTEGVIQKIEKAIR